MNVIDSLIDQNQSFLIFWIKIISLTLWPKSMSQWKNLSSTGRYRQLGDWTLGEEIFHLRKMLGYL